MDNSDFRSKLFSEKRKCIYYVPWISLLSVIFIASGIIVWAVGISSAIQNMDKAIKSVYLNIEAQLTVAQKVATLIVACCGVFALGMLGLSIGRSCTEYAVDQRGAPTRGSPYWLGTSVFVTALWWLLLLLLMFVFFASCIGFAAAAAASTTVGVAAKSATFVSAGIKYYNMTKTILQEQLGPLPAGLSNSTCPPNCLKFDLVEYLLERKVCLCNGDALVAAHRYLVKVQGASITMVAGALLLWMGASFLLMNAAADFGQSRRERALLLRVQRTLGAAGGGQGGKAGPYTNTSDGEQIQQLQLQVQQEGQPLAEAGIQLAAAAYGMSPPYVDGPPYGDVDKVPLLKDSQQAYQQPYEQPYQQQEYQLGYQEQPPVVVVSGRPDAPGQGARPFV